MALVKLNVYFCYVEIGGFATQNVKFNKVIGVIFLLNHCRHSRHRFIALHGENDERRRQPVASGGGVN